MFIDDYEQVLVSEARRRECDGVICGHIHKAENSMYDDIHYLNCGDWVESCTVVAETPEGEWELFRFHDDAQQYGEWIPDQNVTCS